MATRRFATVLFMSLLCLASPAASSADPQTPLIGQPAPVLRVARWVRGGPVERWEPGRIYVIDFWSTWCKPCIDAMPALRKLEASYSDSVTVIGMNVWEFDEGQLDKFLETRGDILPAVVALDSVPPGKEVNEGLTAATFLGTADTATIPKTFVIDQQGKLVWIGTVDGLEGQLQELLADTLEAERESP
jgi:thiol-disulfide isomerase/thioredoxin